MAKHYDSVVTFNGRGFDVPFIYLRSALLNVPITKKNWLGYRYAVEPHCDLAEQFTFYGVSGREGAAAVQPGFLLQGVRHRIAEKSRRHRHGREHADGRGQVPGDRRILPARRPRHGGALPHLEGKARGDKMNFTIPSNIRPHWNYFLALEKDLENVSRY